MNTITEDVKRAARAAVKLPIPAAKPKNYARFGETRDEWRKYQGDKHLPSEKFILKDGQHGWSQLYSPFEPGGRVKTQGELRELAQRLSSCREKVYFVRGEPGKDGVSNIVGVILDGSCTHSPYLFVAADKPGQKVTVEDGKVRFEGALYIEGIDGTLIDGGTFAVEKMPKVTLRTHDKGGLLKCSDPDLVEVKGEGCEVEKAKPKAVKARGRE